MCVCVNERERRAQLEEEAQCYQNVCEITTLHLNKLTDEIIGLICQMY